MELTISMVYQTHKFSICCLVLVVFLAMVFGQDVLAQSAKLPDLTVPTAEESLKDDNFKPSEVPNIQLNNTYLNDIVKLQYQISLLQDLLERQRKIYEIQQTYEQLGLKFKPTPPPFDLCRLVPPNIPCFEAYPYLYPKIQQLEEQEKAKRAAQAAAIRKARTQVSQPKAQKKVQKPAKPKVTQITSDYKWADVFCVADECKAILVEANNRKSRQTVIEGDELLDGSKVTKITSGLIQVQKKGKTLTLDPAPAVSDGGPLSPLSALYGATEVAAPSTPNVPESGNRGGNSALEAELMEQFGGNSIIEVVDDEDTPQQGGVGATGLF